jgi:hypothetical protein
MTTRAERTVALVLEVLALSADLVSPNLGVRLQAYVRLAALECRLNQLQTEVPDARPAA